MCITVREISNEEGDQLKRILRRSSDSFQVKRAQVILASAQGRRVAEVYLKKEERIEVLL